MKNFDGFLFLMEFLADNLFGSDHELVWKKGNKV
jgi:hypothetical protein